MSKLRSDFWYGDTIADCDKYDCYFSDLDCVYSGNYYKNGKAVGDFTAISYQVIEEVWNKNH